MKFPAGYPDFNSAERRKLKSLGVTDAQVIRLRLALAFVKAISSPRSYASSKEVSSILSDIEKLSGSLSKRLIALARRTDAAQNAAYSMLEIAYWSNPEHAGNDGPDIPIRMLPELHALSAAAKSAKAVQPTKPKGRTPTADPGPIRHIHEALLNGWRDTHGSNVTSTPEEIPNMKPLPYPATLRPSKAENSGFRSVVGICYQAVGATPDPVRAIENYLANGRKSRREAVAAFDKGVAAANRKTRRAATKGA